MSTIVKEIQDKIAEKIIELSLQDSPLIIAYSGGPDSTVLLDALVLIRNRYRDLSYSLKAVYINHRLRSDEELHREEKLMKKNCAKLQVPLIIRKIKRGEVQAHAYAQGGRGIEDAARIVRYRELIEEAGKDNSSILTAHNFDDQLETMIMRFFQGSSISGLKGIPLKNNGIFRPMLSVDKNSVYQYLETRGLETSIDSTNLAEVYKRNKLRRILPAFEKLFPGYRNSLFDLSEKMEMLLQELDAGKPKYADFFNIMRSKGDAAGDARVCIAPERILGLSEYRRLEFLYHVWDVSIGKGLVLPYSSVKTALLYFEHVYEGKNTISDGIHTSGKFDFSIDIAGSRIFFHKDKIIWERVVVPARKFGYLKVVHTVDSRLRIADNHYMMDIHIRGSFSESELGLVKDYLSFPLIIRSVQESDTISTASGTKKVNKLFKDWKVPAQKRWEIPVIEDMNGIQAVMAGSFGYFDRVAYRHLLYTSEEDTLIPVFPDGTDNADNADSYSDSDEDTSNTAVNQSRNIELNSNTYVVLKLRKIGDEFGE
ncbi:MAG: tRNA lysidine(34) synthetase TilS [Spirochaetia bacterium]|nr:tRNA lysidine(34) synthetase TilS [Spirochaetia bacterium]MCF7952722.1 tRNA lysidine(34) synthetase TilS [Spirochaetales bacterium]